MATVGYSSRCKVCNSAHRAEIERWVRDGLSFRQTSEMLLEKYGEKISFSAIKRHMAEHFDVQAVARDKYEKAKIQEQHEKSQQLMEQEVDKLLSEVEMLDQAARRNYKLFMTAADLIEKLMASEKKLPQTLVQLAKSSSEEMRQNFKQKQELLGLGADEEKKLDFADLLLAVWEQMEDEQQ